ncbi:MAG: methylenetetrahydrofolate reductase [Acidimicrobiia bacterium]|nr:methylenetetrahydrofolate reductase [Acidimicrobiia bacterium]
MTTSTLTDAQRREIRRVLTDPVFELIPLKNVMDQAAHLPAGATVSVTASPAKTLEDTLDLAAALQAEGFRVIPHLSARMTRDRAHLEALLDRLAEMGLDQAFVVGGDAEYTGEFYDAESLLSTMTAIGHDISDIGIGSYPEGHHIFDPPTAAAALHAKQPYATSMTSQMCFDGPAISDWLRMTRAEGITLPLYLGIPGVAERMKLMKIATRIGVGQSARFLAHNKSLVRTFIQPGGYSADELLEDMVDTLADETANVAGVHIYTFNQVETTERWRRDYLDLLR